MQYAVCNPGPQEGWEDVLRSILPARLFASYATPPDLTHKVRNDPFRVLSYDAVLGIFDFLSTPEILAVMTASYQVLHMTRDAMFWEYMLRKRVSPWFWELNGLIASRTLPATLDYKGLFLWLHTATMPEVGCYGKLMGIANRRRIWDVCQQLVPLYIERANPKEHIEPADEEADAILVNVTSTHMPVIVAPQPSNAQTVSTQFIRSWREISQCPCDMHTYWDNDSLSGIVITFGSYKRLFGSATNGRPGNQMHIEAHDWIKEIGIYVERSDGRIVAIIGMSVSVEGSRATVGLGTFETNYA
jgi:hypothetical protein